jgi:hypothetical protein
MAMVDLKGLYRVTAKGRAYWYAWRGGPRITATHGTPAFAAEYAAHHAARKGGDKARISGLIVDWKSSDAWTLPPEKGGLAESTKKNWRGPLDAIQTHFGQVRVEAFDDQKAARRNISQWLKAWSDRPRTCDMHKQVLSALLSYAVEGGPAQRQPVLRHRQRLRDRPRRHHLDRRGHHAAGRPRQPGDHVRAGPRLPHRPAPDRPAAPVVVHIGDLAVEMRHGQEPRARPRPARRRDPDVRRTEALPDGDPQPNGPIVLTNSDGVPWRSGFPSSWNKALKAAGLQGRLHFHDSRGTFATATYELDVFTIKELAEMLAWSVDKVERIINRYVRRTPAARQDPAHRRSAEVRTSQERNCKTDCKTGPPEMT